ncbi:MAG: PaaI family thioesterase [Sedimentisphaerales bacterium]|nr:PaaI family thioesterase [Sedimentisphaerales bacterium]MBN2842171.1 PaaI family thioesterase [Sedimentisphaerales bacterium]
MTELYKKLHNNCFACGADNPDGLKLKFTADQNGKVSSDFIIPEQYQGYKKIVHGGIIATILDCAMVHCLFARSICAVTIEMNVRYRHPFITNQPAQATAELISQSHGIFCLTASIIQDNKVRATAQARFYRSDDLAQ